MIPVLGCPHLDHPELLTAMLQSIDESVGRLVIVDNGIYDADAAAIALWAAGALPNVEHVRVIEMGWNIGVPAALNLVIKATPDAPWWAFVNNDVAFAPGDLARLASFMDTTPGPVIGSLFEWAAMAINAEALAAVGWWDENFSPIYGDDPDMEWRAHLAGVPVVSLGAGLSHVGSVCLNKHQSDNVRTFPANIAYYRAKWGGSPRGGETYDSPFDAGGDIRAWTLDPTRLVTQAWRTGDTDGR